ncbi:MAG: hybrid sensor histidine kinase/response regulator, partial [Desulfobulbaceae bacterium]
MTSTPLTTGDKLSRLQRKVEILETMLEDHARQAYFDGIRRSIINAMLELSLRVNSMDDLLDRTLEILLSTDLIPLANKGAIFLCDRASGKLEPQTRVNLSAEATAELLHLPGMPDFCAHMEEDRNTGRQGRPPDQLHLPWPEMKVPGHYLLPIRTGQRLYGLIILFLPESLPRTSEDYILLCSIADICAGAMERIYYARELLAYQKGLEQTLADRTRELVKEKERLAVTLRSIADGVITTDTAGRVVLVNRAAERLTGWSRAEAAGRALGEIFAVFEEQTRQQCADQVQRILGAGAVACSSTSCILAARNGQERHIVVSGAPICDEQSRVIGVVLVCSDVTDKLRVEKELVRIQKLEMVGVLAGGIAHDFNNILVGILGNINLACLSLTADHKALALLKEAEQASQRAKKLTGKLLAFARGGEPVKEVSSLGEVIAEEAAFVPRGSNVSCRTHIPEDLWPAAIDKGQIGQAFQNLIMNARQAMPDGGTIEVRCENRVLQAGQVESLAPGNYLEITITDQGCGIPAPDLDRIFEPFFSTKKEGSGMGLAITHSIVAKHGGRVLVSSREGQGATFTVYLPAAAEGQQRDVQKEKVPGGGRVLVMDDEDTVRDVAASMLEFLGYEVELAREGREAVDIYARRLQSGAP